MYHDIFERIKEKRYRKCYQDLDYAVQVVAGLEDDEISMNEIADRIRDITGKKRSTILKSLSRAVDDLWDHGDRKTLEEMYEFRMMAKPSPREIIARLAQYQKYAVEYQLCQDEKGNIVLVAINPVLQLVYGKIELRLRQLTMDRLIWFLNRIQASPEMVQELFDRKDSK